MSNLNEFLKKNDLYLTLTNEQGEALQAGPAEYVKPLKTKTVIRWNVAPKVTAFPFTTAVLHGARKVFAVLFIKAVLPTTETIAELEY